jgi:predicted Rossmann fold flavoprotein
MVAMKKIAVIGGGAAGLAAAVNAVRPTAQVTLFEAADRVGKSILASGNGRCNFSNANIDPQRYNQPFFVEESMGRLPAEEVLRFFKELGLLWAEEEEGRLYPRTNKASSVLDVLRFAAEGLGVRFCLGATVQAVTPIEGRYQVHAVGQDIPGREGLFDAVILACGGKVARSILPLHYPYLSPRPVLGAIKTDTGPIRGLNNIRVRCAISGAGYCEKGEVLFRDYGISGIATFNLSRVVEAGSTVILDFFPELSRFELECMLKERLGLLSKREATRRPLQPGQDCLLGNRQEQKDQKEQQQQGKQQQGQRAQQQQQQQQQEQRAQQQQPQQEQKMQQQQASRQLSQRTALEFCAGMLQAPLARAVLRRAQIHPEKAFEPAQAAALAQALKAFPLEVLGIADTQNCQVWRGGFSIEPFDPATMGSKLDAGLYAAGEALDVDGPCGGYNLHWAWTSGILAGRNAALFVEDAGSPAIAVSGAAHMACFADPHADDAGNDARYHA